MVRIDAKDYDSNKLSLFALRRDSQLRPHSAMVVDSERVVRRALESGVQPRAILLTAAHLARHEGLVSRFDCDVIVAEEAFMAEIVGHRVHQGMMMVAERPQEQCSQWPDRIVALCGVTDAQNVGGIVRSAHAFGYGAVAYDARSCSPFSRRSIRVSMGSVFKLQVGRIGLLTEFIHRLNEYQVIVTGSWGEAVAIDCVRKAQKQIVVIGNEDSGVTDEVAELADAKVFIPMASGIDSLNAAAATAIALYELAK